MNSFTSRLNSRVKALNSTELNSQLNSAELFPSIQFTIKLDLSHRRIKLSQPLNATEFQSTHDLTQRNPQLNAIQLKATQLAI